MRNIVKYFGIGATHQLQQKPNKALKSCAHKAAHTRTKLNSQLDRLSWRYEVHINQGLNNGNKRFDVRPISPTSQ